MTKRNVDAKRGWSRKAPSLSCLTPKDRCGMLTERAGKNDRFMILPLFLSLGRHSPWDR